MEKPRRVNQFRMNHKEETELVKINRKLKPSANMAAFISLTDTVIVDESHNAG
jgi:hypothetical protein